MAAMVKRSGRFSIGDSSLTGEPVDSNPPRFVTIRGGAGRARPLQENQARARGKTPSRELRQIQLGDPFVVPSHPLGGSSLCSAGNKSQAEARPDGSPDNKEARGGSFMENFPFGRREKSTCTDDFKLDISILV
jgi:hypothetical protein